MVIFEIVLFSCCWQFMEEPHFLDNVRFSGSSAPRTTYFPGGGPTRKNQLFLNFLEFFSISSVHLVQINPKLGFWTRLLVKNSNFSLRCFKHRLFSYPPKSRIRTKVSPWGSMWDNLWKGPNYKFPRNLFQRFVPLNWCNAIRAPIAIKSKFNNCILNLPCN